MPDGTSLAATACIPGKSGVKVSPRASSIRTFALATGTVRSVQILCLASTTHVDGVTHLSPVQGPQNRTGLSERTKLAKVIGHVQLAAICSLRETLAAASVESPSVAILVHMQVVVVKGPR